MKYKLLFILILYSQLCFGQFYGSPNEEFFRVSGDAILRIEPDQVVFSLGVQSRGEDLPFTKKENYAIISRAIKYCKEQGISEKYIQTDYLSIKPFYDHGYDLKVDGFEVKQSLTIILEDLNKYEKILTDLLNLGINIVENIDFRTTKLKENRYKVRSMAIEAAKEKAIFLTEQVDIELEEIINITESTQNPIPSFNRYNYANISQNIVQNYHGETGDSPLAIGMLSLKANVSLTYRIKNWKQPLNVQPYFKIKYGSKS